MGKQYLNGVLYGSSEILKFTPYIYSTDEREVGVWLDGKPLYQKTKVCNLSDMTEASSSVYYKAIADSGQQIKAVTGYAESSVYGRCEFGTRSYIYGTNNTIYWEYTNQRNNITIRCYGTEAQPSSLGTVTVYYTYWYTKTTDVAGSGRYTTTGGEAHHYSETEQVIGTWIDGSPLYERTLKLDLPTTISDRNWFTINTGLSGITAIEYTAVLMNSNNRAVAWSPRFVTNTVSGVTPNQPLNTTQTFNVMFQTSTIAVQLGSNITSGSYIALTVRYRKTT